MLFLIPRFVLKTLKLSGQLKLNMRLRNDNIITRQWTFHLQKFIFVAFPKRNTIFGRFSSAPNAPLLSQKRKFYLIVVSPFLTEGKIHKQNVRGIVLGFSGDILCVFLHKEWQKNTHIQTNFCHRCKHTWTVLLIHQRFMPQERGGIANIIWSQS